MRSIPGATTPLLVSQYRAAFRACKCDAQVRADVARVPECCIMGESAIEQSARRRRRPRRDSNTPLRLARPRLAQRNRFGRCTRGAPPRRVTQSPRRCRDSALRASRPSAFQTKSAFSNLEARPARPNTFERAGNSCHDAAREIRHHAWYRHRTLRSSALFPGAIAS